MVISIHCYFRLLVSALHLLLTDAPQVTIVGYDNNWYIGRTNVVLTCQATANPVPVSVSWKTWVLVQPSSWMKLSCIFFPNDNLRSIVLITTLLAINSLQCGCIIFHKLTKLLLLIMIYPTQVKTMWLQPFLSIIRFIHQCDNLIKVNFQMEKVTF